VKSDFVSSEWNQSVQKLSNENVFSCTVVNTNE